jgi:hypothetical protein
MDQETRERLKPVNFQTLEVYDRGSLARRLGDAWRNILDNISRYPLRDGKAEPRKIIIELTIIPEVAKVKEGMERNGRQQEIEVPRIVGLKTFATIKDKLPTFQSSEVCMAVDIRNDRIVDARFNPNNPSSPNKLEFDLEIDGFDDEDE